MLISSFTVYSFTVDSCLQTRCYEKQSATSKKWVKGVDEMGSGTRSKPRQLLSFNEMLPKQSGKNNSKEAETD
jgi:hypothetical protein